MREWWLDCICGHKFWDVILYAPHGEIEAAMPFYMPARGIIIMPPFTQTMGIWFSPTAETMNMKHLHHWKQTVCEYFINNLPEVSVFHQNFHYLFADWLPFYWHGFSQTTRYNYVLPIDCNRQILWNGIAYEIRRNIRRANEVLKYDSDFSVKQFIELNANVFLRQGEKQYKPKHLEHLINTSLELGKGQLKALCDATNDVVAAAFFVCDGDTAWYIASGSNPVKRHPGALARLIWDYLSSLPREVKFFDFEGSMIRGVSNFFRRFGALQMPYFSIEKGSLSLFDRIRISVNSRF
jgi:hypothetical protein